MKNKFLVILFCLSLASALQAQISNEKSFQLVYTRVGVSVELEAQGIFQTNIYDAPNVDATVVDILGCCYHGLCPAVLISHLGAWCQIEGGFIQTKDISFQN